MLPSSPVKTHRPSLLRAIQARQLLVICFTVSLLTAVLIPLAFDTHTITRIIISWNIGAGLYLTVALVVMFRSNPDKMRATAMQYDDGKYVVLTLVVLSAIMCLGAIARRPWVIGKGADEQIVIRSVCTLSLTFDHRLVDGELASKFLSDVAAILADPGLAMMF